MNSLADAAIPPPNGSEGIRLIVAIHPRGEPRFPQDFHRLLGAMGIGLDQDKFAVVVERHGVGMDDIGRHMIVGKVGLESLDDRVLGVLSRLSPPLFGAAAPRRRRTVAGRKDRRTAATRLPPTMASS